MIYGGHTDPFDYHLTGLTFAILGNLLILAGFGEVKRVESFDIFQDTSDLIYDGQRISLNVIAKK